MGAVDPEDTADEHDLTQDFQSSERRLHGHQDLRALDGLDVDSDKITQPHIRDPRSPNNATFWCIPYRMRHPLAARLDFPGRFRLMGA